MKLIITLAVVILLIFPYSIQAKIYPLNQHKDSTKINKLPKYGLDSISCIKNLVIYREYYKLWKQSNYNNDMIFDAYLYWYNTYTICPESTENIYVDGIRMINYIIKIEPDTYRRNQLIDTLMMLYDKHIEFFPPRYEPRLGKILGRKGVNLYKLDSTRYVEVHDILCQSIQLSKEKSKKYVFLVYLQTIEKMYYSKLISTEEAKYEFMQIIQYFNSQIEIYKRNQKENKLQELTNYMSNIEGIYNNMFDNDNNTNITLK